MAFPNYVYLKQPLRRISDYPSSNPHHKNSSGAKPFVSKSVPYSIFAQIRAIFDICAIFAQICIFAPHLRYLRVIKKQPRKEAVFCLLHTCNRRDDIYPASGHLSTTARKLRPALLFGRKAGIRLRCRSGQTECSGWSGAFL